MWWSDDDRVHDLAGKLDRQQSHCHSPDLVAHGASASEMQRPANRKRKHRDCREDAGAVLDQRLEDTSGRPETDRPVGDASCSRRCPSPGHRTSIASFTRAHP
jgi:hypothetical protein